MADNKDQETGKPVEPRPTPAPAPRPAPKPQPQDDPLPPGHIDPPGKSGGG